MFALRAGFGIGLCQRAIGAGKDDPAGGVLQGAGDDHLEPLADPAPGPFHHHHGAVVEVADALVCFLAVAGNLEQQLIAGPHLGAQGDDQLTEVEHLEGLHLSHLGQVVVGGQQGAAGIGGEQQQLVVDPLALVAGAVHHQAPAIDLPQLAEQLEAAPAPAALLAIGRIGQGLELIDHALGDDHLALQQARIQQAADAAINDHAGVEDLGAGRLQHPFGHQQGLGAAGVEQAQQGAAVNFGQVVARHPKENIAEHRRQRFDEHHLPGQGQQQDRRQQQVCHQQAQDQADGAAHQQVGGHRAHLGHQPAAQLAEEEARQQAEEGPEAPQDRAQALRFVHLQQ